MRKNITLLALAIVSMATLFSCSKSSSSSPSSTLTATVNGKSFSSSTCTFANGSGLLSIIGSTGAAGSLPAIDINIYNFTTTGTYTIDGSTVTASIDSSTSSLNSVSSGSITITSYSSTNVAGTFSFTCTDGTTITGGTFSAKN